MGSSVEYFAEPGTAAKRRNADENAPAPNGVRRVLNAADYAPTWSGPMLLYAWFWWHAWREAGQRLQGMISVGTGRWAVRAYGMDSVTLHVAARRYLMRRYDELTDAYAALPNQGRADDGFHYLPESWRIFPRYNTAAAMLVDVERLDPDRLPRPPVLVENLAHAAETAQSAFTHPPHNDVAAAAMDDERRRFRDAVRAWAADEDLRLEPLPYRRVLTPAESTRRQQQLRKRWGLVDRCWYPMLADPTPPHVLVLVEHSMWDEQVTARLRAVLRQLGGHRVTGVCCIRR